jgi:hypothetical protein
MRNDSGGNGANGNGADGANGITQRNRATEKNNSLYKEISVSLRLCVIPFSPYSPLPYSPLPLSHEVN